jgi:hypothetical protein
MYTYLYLQLIANMEGYYAELGKYVMHFARMEPGNTIEVPMAIRAYDSMLSRNGVSLKQQGKSIGEPLPLPLPPGALRAGGGAGAGTGAGTGTVV